MNRPYTRARYLEIVEALRRVRPDMSFSTDIIVGFPGETEADFAQTLELFEAVNYDMAYIFKYSTRTGTPAATLTGQVPAAVKEGRNQILLRLLEKNSRRRNQSLVGTVQEVLVEGPDKKGLRYMGRTRGNRLVHFEATEHLIGELVPVHIARATASALYGAPALAGVAP
jgi:tRNA-2-methylthio-N6-dimethylallyladenosine synthase